MAQHLFFQLQFKIKLKELFFALQLLVREVDIPYLETGFLAPSDPYGISKLAAEKLINLCETYGVEYNIAVPHNIIGPKQKYDDPFRNVALSR